MYSSSSHHRIELLSSTAPSFPVKKQNSSVETQKVDRSPQSFKVVAGPSSQLRISLSWPGSGTATPGSGLLTSSRAPCQAGSIVLFPAKRGQASEGTKLCSPEEPFTRKPGPSPGGLIHRITNPCGLALLQIKGQHECLQVNFHLSTKTPGCWVTVGLTLPVLNNISFQDAQIPLNVHSAQSPQSYFCTFRK